MKTRVLSHPEIVSGHEVRVVSEVERVVRGAAAGRWVMGRKTPLAIVFGHGETASVVWLDGTEADVATLGIDPDLI